jgi:hypothetical protein
MSSANAAARGRRPRQHLFASNAEMDDSVPDRIELRSAQRGQLPVARSPDRPTGAGKEPRRLAQSATHPRAEGVSNIAAFDREIAALYAQGRSVWTLAKAYGVGQQAVRTALYRSDLTLRGKGGQPSKIAAAGAPPGKGVETDDSPHERRLPVVTQFEDELAPAEIVNARAGSSG